MPSVRKRTNLKNVYEKVYVKRPSVRKLNFKLQTYSKAYKSRDQLYENMQRVTGLFGNTNVLYKNVQTFPNLHENVEGKRPCVRKHNFNMKIYSKA